MFLRRTNTGRVVYDRRKHGFGMRDILRITGRFMITETHELLEIFADILLSGLLRIVSRRAPAASWAVRAFGLLHRFLIDATTWARSEFHAFAYKELAAIYVTLKDFLVWLKQRLLEWNAFPEGKDEIL